MLRLDKLYTVIDKYIEYVGFIEFTVRDKRMYFINGKVICRIEVESHDKKYRLLINVTSKDYCMYDIGDVYKYMSAVKIRYLGKVKFLDTPDIDTAKRMVLDRYRWGTLLLLVMLCGGVSLRRG